MTIDEMREKKRELGYTYEQLSELSGVPLGTVQKIFSGHTKSPRYDTIRALEKVLGDYDEYQWEMREQNIKYAVESGQKGIPGSHKKQGEYTLEDYYALPDDRRVELIDGVIYDMTAPSFVHQQVCGLITGSIQQYIFRKGSKCVVSQAPTDVWLDMDDKTMVQPDVLVICDRDKLEIKRTKGAPDFVVEVLSPSTRGKDMRIKTGKYMNAGVREYWLVDLKHRRVIIHDFEQDDLVSVFTFEEKVPIMITGGELQIDLPEIKAYLDDLFGDSW